MFCFILFLLQTATTNMKIFRQTLTALALAIACLSNAHANDLTEEQKTLYALGQNIAQNLGAFSLTGAELEHVKTGLTDGILGNKSAVEMNEYGPKIQALAQARQGAVAAKQAEIGKAFLDKAAKETGAVKTASGMVYLSQKAGAGESPAATDTVKVHYRGTLIDGKEFDSSYKRNAPAEFPLNGVIKCWTEGVQKMKVGGKAKLVCPANLAYGDRGSPPNIAGGATLQFEVELLGITKAAKK